MMIFKKKLFVGNTVIKGETGQMGLPGLTGRKGDRGTPSNWPK